MEPISIVTYTIPGEPEVPGEQKGKFLQLYWRKREYLVFAPSEVHRYHTQLLARFLEDNTIAYHWVSEEKVEVDDPALIVTGGGKFRLSQNRQTLELWDNSQAFGRFDDVWLTEKFAASGHAWSGLDVVIS